MKKVPLLAIIGALAWSMQACSNPQNTDQTDQSDSLNTESMTPMGDEMDTSYRDTIGQGDIEYTDTTSSTPNSPGTTPVP